MSDAWSDGAHTLHGVLTRDFPNLLMISTVQGGFGVNFVHYLTETSAHVAAIISRCEREGIAEIEPTDEAQEAWFMLLMTMVDGIARYNATCTPGYLNNEGLPPDESGGRGAAYMRSAVEFKDLLAAWRDDGSYVGLVRSPITA